MADVADDDLKLPHAEPGMTIGLFGGSFNPAHDGHRHVSLEMMRRLQLDRVWWLLTPGNPLKDHAELGSLANRIAHARAVADHPDIEVTGFEALLPSPFTADTIREIQRRLPRVAFVWIMGADNLAGFHRWHRWREIMRLIPIAVADRPGWRHRALASVAARAYARVRLDSERAVLLPRLAPPAWVLIDIRLSSLSSTEIRRNGPVKWRRS